MEPKIRLKGFSEEWEKVKLGEISNKVTQKNLKGQYMITLTNSAEFGVVSQRDFFDHDISNTENIQGYYVVENGSFVYNPRISVTAPFGPINKNNLGYTGVMSPLYYVFRIHDIDEVFLEYFFKTSLWHKFMKDNGNTGARFDRLSISDDVFEEMPIFVPSLPEQRALATFFTSLDNQISAAEKRLASLKQVKAVSLQAMFPQEGETTPKLRFKGCEGEWEKVKLGEVFELRNGYTPSKAVDAFWTNGTIPWFRMEDIRDKGGLLKDAYQKITPEAVKGGGLFEANSILLATTATIGVHAMLIADSLANQRFTNLSIRKSLVDKYLPMFVYYAFFGIDEWCLKNTNTGGLLSVDINELCKLPFLTPSLSEQRQIASYFISLDRQITSQSSKISKLKQIKSACLDQMFV